MKTSERRRPGENDGSGRKRVAIIVYEGALLLNVAGPAESFFWANRELGRAQEGKGRPSAGYDVTLLSERGGLVRTPSGIELMTEALPSAAEAAFDTVAVVGGMGVRAFTPNDPLVGWLDSMQGRVRRIASFGSGVFALAQAGLLDGRRCAAHWRVAEVLSDSFPATLVEPGMLFVRDGNILTAAGSTASIDLALKMIEDDFGRATAIAVARVLVISRLRSGEQPQFSAELRAQLAATPRIAAAAEWIVNNIDTRPTVAAIAGRFAMSERNFSRLFTRETGFSPRRYLELVRIEAARRWLTGSRLPIEKVALRSGFSSGETLTHSFKKVMGVSPTEYRGRADEHCEDF